MHTGITCHRPRAAHVEGPVRSLTGFIEVLTVGVRLILLPVQTHEQVEAWWWGAGPT